MYRLPQAGIISQRILEQRLNAVGYSQSTTTPGLWTHKWRPITFTLCVDDFGVKYVGREHAQHIMDKLQANYTISQDWEVTRYLGIDLDWDYCNKRVHLLMLSYIADTLKRFHHKPHKKSQDQPHPHVQPNYGAKAQYTDNPDTSPLLKKIILNSFSRLLELFCTMRKPSTAPWLQPSDPLQCNSLHPQNPMHPDSIVTYTTSDMVLEGHSDASYLSKTNAQSRAGGNVFMSADSPDPLNNGAVLTIDQIIKAVMSFAAEAKLGALFINCRKAIPARLALEEMVHKQTPKPIQTDNTTALGVVQNNLATKRFKLMDMKFHWLRCREAQRQFRNYWRAGSTNRGDYVTKHHAAIHHRAICPQLFTPKRTLLLLWHKQKQNQGANILRPPIPLQKIGTADAV